MRDDMRNYLLPFLENLLVQLHEKRAALTRYIVIVEELERYALNICASLEAFGDASCRHWFQIRTQLLLIRDRFGIQTNFVDEQRFIKISRDIASLLDSLSRALEDVYSDRIKDHEREGR